VGKGGAATSKDKQTYPIVQRDTTEHPLRVPPFLAWHTTIEASSPEVPAVKGFLDVVHDKANLIRLTLYAIERQMRKERPHDVALSIDSEHPFMNLYRSGVAFTDIPEARIDGSLSNAMDECRQACHEVLAMSPNDHKFSVREFAIMEDTHALLLDTSPRKTTTTGIEVFTSADFDRGTGCEASARRVTQWQTALMEKHVNLVIESILDLVDQFVPKYYDQAILRRCWGAMETMLKVRSPS
jgi:hypothetical protein